VRDRINPVPHRISSAVAVDFDAVLGDTEPLWRAWLEDARRRYRVQLDDDPDEAALDAAIGNWRPLLERFAEDHARVYLRPNPAANAELRRLAASGTRVGAFTDAPEPLARVAAAHLGVARRVEILETGTGALERLLATLGEGAKVVRSLEAF
jgi:phosphoglycolate phosphatase-like HAD superfamily hydrolase